MNSTTKWIIGIVILAIIVIGAFMFMGKPVAAPTTENTAVQTGAETGQPSDTSTASSSTNTTTVVTTTTTVSGPVTVTYNGSAFSPATVTIKAGQSVTFVNQSNGSMWVASAMHPSHTVYDGNDRTTHCAAGYTGPAPFDECAAGASYTFMFDKAGTWKYHNHMNASAFGSVVVQ